MLCGRAYLSFYSSWYFQELSIAYFTYIVQKRNYIANSGRQLTRKCSDIPRSILQCIEQSFSTFRSLIHLLSPNNSSPTNMIFENSIRINARKTASLDARTLYGNHYGSWWSKHKKVDDWWWKEHFLNNLAYS